MEPAGLFLILFEHERGSSHGFVLLSGGGCRCDVHTEDECLLQVSWVDRVKMEDLEDEEKEEEEEGQAASTIHYEFNFVKLQSFNISVKGDGGAGHLLLGVAVGVCAMVVIAALLFRFLPARKEPEKKESAKKQTKRQPVPPRVFNMAQDGSQSDDC